MHPELILLMSSTRVFFMGRPVTRKIEGAQDISIARLKGM